MLVPSASEARWSQDASNFSDRVTADDSTINVNVLNAQGSESTEISEAETAIQNCVNVLVVAPVDPTDTAWNKVVSDAHNPPNGCPAGIVISYDQLIVASGVDYYTGYDWEAAGKLAGAFIVHHAQSHGRLDFVNNPGNDTRSVQMYQGEYGDILSPEIKSGKFRVAGLTWTAKGTFSQAKRAVNAALARNDKHVAAVITQSDTLAGGAAAALQSAGLTRHTLVTGAGASLSSLRSILGGTLAMTIYMPVYKEAYAAADLTAAYVSGGSIPGIFSQQVDVGDGPVPSAVFSPTSVTADSIHRLIRDGWVSYRAVCKGLKKQCKKHHV